MPDIIALGAEAQAATSIACAYPDREVTFVSDHDDILDGSDLPNVHMLFAEPADRAKLTGSAVQVVALCPRWLEPTSVLSLSVLFQTNRATLSRIDVASTPEPAPGIVDPQRRPPPSAGCANLRDGARVRRHCRCARLRLVYQPLLETSATILTVGRRQQGTQLGCVQVFEERFFWDNILQAAETIDAPDVVSASLDLLQALNHRGYFTFNWLRTRVGLRLSSLRPIPRAIFRVFLRSGVDLLDDRTGTSVVRGGLRLIATPTYVPFERLR